MSKVLLNQGAEIAGFSRCSDKEIDFFSLSGVKPQMKTYQGDIRNFDALKKAMDDFHPEVVIHMAAQPLVRESYERPLETYEVNVLGTANVLECIRRSEAVTSFLNVTTDKVYQNDENNRADGFKENEPLDGYDPYSNSKSCSELVTHSYRKSFFSDNRCAISTARAGNVIGGGDFSKDRIIPDCVRKAVAGENIIVRNPDSTRPYQHVLEPVLVYLMIALHPEKSGYYNVGPNDGDCFTTGDLTDLFIRFWGENVQRVDMPDRGPHEAGFLKLDSGLLKDTFQWNPVWNLERAVEYTVEWYKVWNSGGDIPALMDEQIKRYIGEMNQ